MIGETCSSHGDWEIYTEQFVGSSWVIKVHMPLRETGYGGPTIFMRLRIGSNSLIFQMRHDDIEIEMNIHQLLKSS
jgi:hypothetical protein